MEVVVMGAGYVGLVQGAGLASSGNSVCMVDISKSRIQMLKQGKCPIFEPGLPALIQSGVKNKCLSFCELESPEFIQSLKNSEIIFLAVGTPEGTDGHPQLDHLFSAAGSLIQPGHDLNGKVVVVKSTVPVGTGDRLEEFYRSKGVHPVVVSNPEFLKQGAAVGDFLKPERVIVGTDHTEAIQTLHFLYKPFMLKKDRFVLMSRRSAELVKYACNSFLATKISFINELSQLAEKLGADIREIREGMITDSRIGDQFLFPGTGYGGSCLPKDTHALIAQAEASHASLEILKAVDNVNQRQKMWSLRKLQEIFNDNLKGKKIALWGLAFKPNTDDLREAPSVYLVRALAESGAIMVAHDPEAMDRAKQEFADFISKNIFRTVEDPYDAVEGADALVVLTEWSNYRAPQFLKLRRIMKGVHILDARLIYEPGIVRKFNLQYYGVGIPTASYGPL